MRVALFPHWSATIAAVFSLFCGGMVSPSYADSKPPLPPTPPMKIEGGHISASKVPATGVPATGVPATGVPARDGTSLYTLSARTITGQDQKLSNYEGKVALIVNVASLCGFTEQYRGLQQLYLKYKDLGFVLLGFPSNDFGEQEPGTDTEIKNFCTGRFGVTFPLFSKTHVTGEGKNPVYEFLTLQGRGKEVEWNFEKFLVGKDGTLLKRFPSSVEPESKELGAAIVEALNRTSKIARQNPASGKNGKIG